MTTGAYCDVGSPSVEGEPKPLIPPTLYLFVGRVLRLGRGGTGGIDPLMDGGLVPLAGRLVPLLVVGGAVDELELSALEGGVR